MYLELSKLKPHPGNPRKISKKELDNLCNSIEKNPEYFEARPIICNKEFLIYAGNSRYKAAKKLELKKVPVFVMDLPKEKMEEIMFRDNVNNGEWDTSLLVDWNIETLIDFGLDFTDSVMKSFTDAPGEEENKSSKNSKKVKKVVTCPHCNKDFEL